jgi:hypothetical protein
MQTSSNGTDNASFSDASVFRIDKTDASTRIDNPGCPTQGGHLAHGSLNLNKCSRILSTGKYDLLNNSRFLLTNYSAACSIH